MKSQKVKKDIPDSADLLSKYAKPEAPPSAVPEALIEIDLGQLLDFLGNYFALALDGKEREKFITEFKGIIITR